MTTIDAIRARLDAITPGKWTCLNRSADGIDDDFLGFDVEGPPEAMRGQFAHRADATFIAHAPDDMRTLLDALAAAEARVAALEDGLRRLQTARKDVHNVNTTDLLVLLAEVCEELLGDETDEP
jgi:hypothetical protein